MVGHARGWYRCATPALLTLVSTYALRACAALSRSACMDAPMSSSSTVTSCAAAWCSSDLMAVHRWVPPKARQGACRAITAPSHTTPRSSARRTTLRGPVALVAGGMRAIWHDSGLPWSRKLPDDQRPKPCHCMFFITNHSRSAKVCNVQYVYTERSPHPLSACYTCWARASPDNFRESEKGRPRHDHSHQMRRRDTCTRDCIIVGSAAVPSSM